MQLDGGCCGRPPSASPLLAPHPRVPSGMVHSRRTCHCHSGGDGSRSVRAEGWVGGREGRKASSTACHCSAAAAAAPKPHREQTPFPPRHNFTPQTPRGPLPFAKVKRLPWFAGGCVAAKELRLDAALPPADTEPSDNGTCRGNFAASTPLAICFRGRRGAGRAMLHG